MISKYSHKNLVWIDLENPKKEEIDYILNEYSIPLSIKEKLEIEKIENIISLENNFIFIVTDISQNIINKENINKLIFIVCDSFIITIHSRKIEAINIFKKDVELNIAINNKLNINSNKTLFISLVQTLYLNSQDELLKSYIKIKNLEEQITNEKRKKKRIKRLSFFLLGVIILISVYVIIYI